MTFLLGEGKLTNCSYHLTNLVQSVIIALLAGGTFMTTTQI